MMALFRLGLRNLLRNRIRTGITLGAIVFGVGGLIVSGGFVRDIFFQLGETLIHSQSGHAQIGHQAIFGYGSRSPERYLLDSPEALRKQLMAQPEVKDVMSRITFAGLLNNGRTDYAIIVDGIEPQREQELGTHLRLVSGRMLTDDDLSGAMLGEGVASALGLVPGDRATLLASTIDGAMNTLDVEVIGVFQTFSKDFDARAVRIALADAQDVMFTDGVSKLVISLHDTSLTDALVERVQSWISDTDLTILRWQELNDFYAKTVDLYQQQFGFLKAMVLLMVCLSVINAVNMSLVERTWEFGTMRALGNHNRSVVGLIVAESLTLGVMGATLGVILGMVLAALIAGVGIPMPPPPNSDLGYDAFIRLVPQIMLESWVIGLAATLIATAWPAWKVTRFTIIDALRCRE